MTCVSHPQLNVVFAQPVNNKQLETSVAVGVGVLVGGTDVLVGVGGTNVLVGVGVLVGGTNVPVGVGGTDVLVGVGVFVDDGVLVGDGVDESITKSQSKGMYGFKIVTLHVIGYSEK